MTDLRQVWVLGANVELIRADQIISVYVKRSDDSDPWPLTLRRLGELKGDACVCAEVLGGREGASREALLLTCHVRQAPTFALPKKLAACAKMQLAGSLYVRPRLAGSVEDLAIDWSAGEDPPESWPNIYVRLLEIAKQRR